MQSRFCAAAKLKTMATQLAALSQTQTRQIESLQKGLIKLQNSQQMEVQRRAAFVSYLIHLANLHLAINHDQKTALTTLQLALQQLTTSQNPAFSTLKQAISSDISALNAVPVVHTHQLFSEIAAINEAIQNLSPLPTQINAPAMNTAENIKTVDANLPWYKQAWESIKQLKTLFVIHHINQPAEPIVAPEQIQNVKQAILAQLNMAQWALLHHDNADYQTALKTVSTWLTRYFSLNDAKNPIQNQLAELIKIQIDPTLPSLNNTLNALSDIKIESAPVGT